MADNIQFCTALFVLLVLLLIDRYTGYKLQSAINRGDQCTIGQRPGQWIDLFRCPKARDYVHLSNDTAAMLEANDDDILVCCDLRYIVGACDPAYVRFELRHVAGTVDRPTPHDVLEEHCAWPPEVGETLFCKVDNHFGEWLCANCDDNTGNETAGESDVQRYYCHLNATMSGDKCAEYSRRMAGVKCDQLNGMRDVVALNLTDMELPFFAELFDVNHRTMHYCSGVLISRDFVLTTAWCLYNRDPRYVRIGGHFPALNTIVGQKIIHSAYNDAERYHNIGLLRLQSPILLSVHVRPACLQASGNNDYPLGVVVGLTEGGSQLIRSTATIMQHTECDDMFYGSGPFPRGIDTATHLCGVRNDIMLNFCELKRGSPLMVPTQEAACVATVLGIHANWDTNCNVTVFIRPSHYLAWIESHIWAAERVPLVL